MPERPVQDLQVGRETVLRGRDRATWDALSALLVRLPAALNYEAEQAGHLNYFSYTVLAALADAPGQRLETATLADNVDAALSRVWYALDKLERAGSVWRERSTRDRRAVVVGLTDAGDARRGQVQVQVDDLVHRVVLSDRSPAALESLEVQATDMLDRLAAARQAVAKGKRYRSAL